MWLFPPMIFWGLYCMIKAMRSAKTDPPADPSHFRRNLWAVFFLGIVPGLVLLLVYSKSFGLFQAIFIP